MVIKNIPTQNQITQLMNNLYVPFHSCFLYVHIPLLVGGELPAGLWAGLLLEDAIWGGGGEELAEEDAMWREHVAEDGEDSCSPDSISVKDNPDNTWETQKTTLTIY